MTTDYSQEAAEYLADAKHTTSPEITRSNLMAAQVKATLAVSEQLRIGNLIALKSWDSNLSREIRGSLGLE